MASGVTDKTPWQRALVAGFALLVAALLADQIVVNHVWATTPQIAQTQAEIAHLNAQREAILSQASALSSRQQALILARENYQLVLPGQRLVQILPAQGSVSQTTGDPGFDPIASPTNGTGYLPKGSHSSASSTSHGFWARLSQTLQFWR